jgi:predicted acylesterase/phospholipase RssA
MNRSSIRSPETCVENAGSRPLKLEHAMNELQPGKSEHSEKRTDASRMNEEVYKVSFAHVDSNSAPVTIDSTLPLKNTSSKYHEPGLAAELLRSAVYSGAEAPARAIAQVVDQVAGTHADKAVKSCFKTVGVEQPMPAEFGTGHWMAQQFGSAAGMIIPMLALRSGISKLATPLEAGLSPFAREIALSGTTGLVYGSLLSPSREDNVGTSRFYTDRLQSGLASGSAFAALGAINPYVSKALGSANAAIEGSTLLPSVVKTPLVEALNFPTASGMISGVPAGVVMAEANALTNGRILPSTQELKESVGSMAFVGGAMGTARWFLEQAAASGKDLQPAVTRSEEGAVGGSEKARYSLSGKVNAKLSSDATYVKANERTLQNDKLRVDEKEVLQMMDENSVKSGDLAKVAGQTDAQRAKSFRSRPFDPNVATDPALGGLDVVLGASGSETTAHVGFLKAIEDNHVPVGRITGVSGGSLVAALYANEYSPDQIKQILLSDEFRHPNLEMIGKIYHVTDPWNLFPYSMDFKPWIEDFVAKYKLKPQPNLRIVAADAKTHEPMIFEGTHYDLATALTASTDATPALRMKPVEVNGHTAVDGYYYHPTPTALCKSPSIASKIGFTSELPHELLAPWDYFFHFKELAYNKELVGRYPDPPGHIIATTGLPDVAMATFSISKATTEKLIEHGYFETMERLKQPDALKVIQEAQKKLPSTFSIGSEKLPLHASWPGRSS